MYLINYLITPFLYQVVILEKEIRVGGRIDTLFFECQQTPKFRGEGKKIL